MLFYYRSTFFMLICLLVSGYASSKVRSTYAKYDRSPCHSGMSGSSTVKKLLQCSGVTDIRIGEVGGLLTDHYHPAKRVINLSERTYHETSIAAVSVAAHEVGHVLQNKTSYWPYQIRTAIVPAVNFGSRIAVPLVLIGVLIQGSAVKAGNSDLGRTLATIGVILYGFSVLFSLVTIPVEINASKRAKELLLSQGILSEDEIPAAKAVLSAAAMTYLASLLVSLINYLRFIAMVTTMFGPRNTRR